MFTFRLANLIAGLFVLLMPAMQKAAIDSAKLQAISTIISRMGTKLAQDIEKRMEMRY
jgi:hypothetical protein